MAAGSGRPAAAAHPRAGGNRRSWLRVRPALVGLPLLALARADVVVPDLPGDFGAGVLAAAGPLGARHTLVRVGVGGLREALAGCPVPLATMGRGLDADLAYFLAAAAAGRHAATLVPN